MDLLTFLEFSYICNNEHLINMNIKRVLDASNIDNVA